MARHSLSKLQKAQIIQYRVFLSLLISAAISILFISYHLYNLFDLRLIYPETKIVKFRFENQPKEIDRLKLENKQLNELLAKSNFPKGVTTKEIIITNKTNNICDTIISDSIFDSVSISSINKYNHQIALDSNTTNFENIARVIYSWGNGENEQKISTKGNFKVKFTTSKPLNECTLKIIIFYRGGDVRIWDVDTTIIR